MKRIEDYVISIPDFPEPGIIFRDVTSVLQDADGLRLAIDLMQEKLKGLEFDLIAGSESRGFIFGAPIAYNLHKPFIPIRKKGKLPRETVSIQYELATGGTNEAMIRLVEGLGGEVVKAVFLMELAGLKGRERLKEYDVDSVIIYPGK